MQWDTYVGLVEKALTQDDLETANGIFAVGIGGYRLSMAQMQRCLPHPLGLHHPLPRLYHRRHWTIGWEYNYDCATTTGKNLGPVTGTMCTSSG